MLLADSRHAVVPFSSRATPAWRPSAQLALCRQAVRLAGANAAAVAAPAAAAAAAGKYPTIAETARTVMALVTEGILSTLSEDGTPLGAPVQYTVGTDGTPVLQLAPGSVQLAHLQRNTRCSLTVQPPAFPARSVASVALVGQLEEHPECQQRYTLTVERCHYFGGLDQRSGELSKEELAAAEPDTLRKCAADLVQAWNSDRAEDMYRIVSDFLGVQLTEMSYAELRWIDRLGMYVLCEVLGQPPAVIRVPFYRAVIDERDARSVITMASQLAWERERNYNPPLPPVLSNPAPASS